MVLATKYLILALTFIVSASQPGISHEQKTQLLAEASKNVALIIPAYIEEQKAIAENASSTPTFGAITHEIAPQDTQIISNATNMAKAKADRVASAKSVYDAVQAEFQANQDAQKANQNRIRELGTGITSGEMGIINREEVRLREIEKEIILRRDSASRAWGNAERSQ